jgi:hypothetical protein
VSEHIGYHNAHHPVGRFMDDVYMRKVSKETIVLKRTVSTELAFGGPKDIWNNGRDNGGENVPRQSMFKGEVSDAGGRGHLLVFCYPIWLWRYNTDANTGRLW